MHIEPGTIAQAKIVVANIAASGVLLHYVRAYIKQPADIIRTVLAALFFTLFMQSFSTPVGPSELHFVGAMIIYLSLGFIPAMFGFAAGLLLQGLIFDPMDIAHLAVNSLSLILPLIAVHFTIGRKLRSQDLSVNWKTIVKMDAIYYAGVTLMVGFWLSVSQVATPFAAWATFTASYLVVVAIEPIVTLAAIKLLKHFPDSKVLDVCFAVKPLKLAKVAGN
ncbi:MAG: energy-coupling factor ABC transporter permease [Gammaproteobacteria bacterium]|nr:energy-coupling factor ABC transporter permease [Gammaproteobacteria bacterium]